jgi:hypothetical protein
VFCPTRYRTTDDAGPTLSGCATCPQGAGLCHPPGVRGHARIHQDGVTGDRIGQMPIPAGSEGGSVTSAVIALFHQAHDQLRDEVNGLDTNALNWVPTAGANSISTIITHLVSSEAETLRCVAGLTCERDREAEFVGKELTMGQVLDLIDRADDLITAVTPRVDPDRLRSVFALPTLPVEELRSGLTWLIGNYGHAREHVGHIQLTKQLYQAEQSSAS